VRFVEKRERRHLDKDQSVELVTTLVELRTKEIATQKELDDNLSRNSSPQPKSPPEEEGRGRQAVKNAHHRHRWAPSASRTGGKSIPVNQTFSTI
jgi:hypothetical protein